MPCEPRRTPELPNYLDMSGPSNPHRDALRRQELHAIAHGRPTGTPATFARSGNVGRHQNPAGGLVLKPSGVERERSRFRGVRLRNSVEGGGRAAGGGSGSVRQRPSSAGIGGRPRSGGRPASSFANDPSYIRIKRAHFPPAAADDRGDEGGEGREGTGVWQSAAATGAGVTASMDSIGRSSGQGVRVGRPAGLGKEYAASQNWDANDEQDQVAASLPAQEMRFSGRAPPPELLTIRPEYSDDMSRVTNSELYAAYIEHLTGSWPGWATVTADGSVDPSADPRAEADLADPNAKWQQAADVVGWLDRIQPRSRLDGLPLYLLCRELLRQVLLREIEYHDTRNHALSAKLTAALVELGRLQAKMAETLAIARAEEEAERASWAATSAVWKVERARLEAASVALRRELECCQAGLTAERAEREVAEAEAKLQRLRAEAAEKELAKEQHAAKREAERWTDASFLCQGLNKVCTDGHKDPAERKMFVAALVTVLDSDEKQTAAGSLLGRVPGVEMQLRSAKAPPWSEMDAGARAGLLQMLLREEHWAAATVLQQLGKPPLLRSSLVDMLLEGRGRGCSVESVLVALASKGAFELAGMLSLIDELGLADAVSESLGAAGSEATEAEMAAFPSQSPSR